MKPCVGLLACAVMLAAIGTSARPDVVLSGRGGGLRSREGRPPRLRRSQGEQSLQLLPGRKSLWGVRGGGLLGRGGKGTVTTTAQTVAKVPPGSGSGAVDSVKDTSRSAGNLYIAKLLMLLFYGSLGSVMPYLPVYYHSLGLPDRQIGLLGAITPAATFLVAPLWGALADHTSRHKDVLLFTFVSSVVTRLLFGYGTTFKWLSCLVLLTAVLNAPVRPLLDSAVLGLLEDKKEYGKQRLWGQFGFGLAGCAVGPLLMNKRFGYRAAFFAHALISIPTLLIMKRLTPSPAPKEAPKFRQGLSVLVHNPDAVVFFFTVFIIGLSSGVIENFAYVRLRECGGEGTVMGVSRLFSSLTGVPMFWFSGHVTKYMSVMGVLMMSVCSYICRFFIYASIRNPWEGLPAEALRGMTFAAMWASSTYYTHRISPKGLSATMLGFLNGMYGGLGQSTGALIGGALASRYGTAKTFVIAGLTDIVILGGLLTYWFFHPDATRLPEEER